MVDFNNILDVFNLLHEAKANYVGSAGESAFNQFALKHLSNDYYILSDIVLKANNGTTQIDQIIVSKFGVFVIEIKAYQGWIWGDAKSAQWTQTLSNGKYRFQNPLRQNYKHVKTLQSLLGYRDVDFKSLIVFSGQAQFRTELPANVVRGGVDYINFINKHQTVLLSDENVIVTIEKILNNRLSNEEHQLHIQKIKQQYNQADKNNAPQCPRCTNTMVLRKSKLENQRGNSFWGCSGYPLCKAIINIKSDSEKIEEQVNKMIKACNFLF